MYLTVSEALKLSAFQNAQVIAGGGGLDRKIYRITVAECPSIPLGVEMAGTGNRLFLEGDFTITSLFALRDNPELLLDTVTLYHQFACSGLVVFRRYFNELPQEVLNFANQVNFPLITLPKTVPYGDVISDVMKALFVQQNNFTAISLIDQILNSNDVEKNEKLAYTLYHKFNSFFVCFYIDSTELFPQQINSLVYNINNYEFFFAVNYYNSILAFATTDKKMSQSRADYFKETITRMLEKNTTNYRMGISDIHNGLKNINTCIKQAITANKVSRIANLKVENYSEIGTYKLFLEIKDINLLKKHYAEYISPLKEYDELKKGELINTMFCFASNSCDIKKTASELFQHENTIRYRLMKIKELLKAKDDDLKFYETLAIVYKLHMILLDGKV